MRFENLINKHMKRNYEFDEFGEFFRENFAAKAANTYEYSYQSATKLQNCIRDNLYNSFNS